MSLHPLGSVEDRVAREMVTRERTERVALVQAIASIAAVVASVDAGAALGRIVEGYAEEVFQEGYDPRVLAAKRARLRAAQARVSGRREEDQRMIQRLDRMSQLGDMRPPVPAAKPGSKP